MEFLGILQLLRIYTSFLALHSNVSYCHWFLCQEVVKRQAAACSICIKTCCSTLSAGGATVQVWRAVPRKVADNNKLGELHKLQKECHKQWTIFSLDLSS